MCSIAILECVFVFLFQSDEMVFLPMKLALIFLSVIFFNSTILSQYSVTSPYLQDPNKAIGYVDSCAKFWLPTWDQSKGGFYTNIDRFGNLISNWGTNKNMLTQSRNVYGLTRAFMLTGDTLYLHYAEKALDWMYKKAWDTVYGGWYQELNINGGTVNRTAEKTAFYQHYALLGIVAYYEATRDTTAWNWLRKGYEHLETKFWDVRTSYKGFFDKTAYTGLNPANKSFNATVDAITTHLLYLYLMTGEEIYRTRLSEIAENIQQYFVGALPSQAIGFVEKFNSDWQWNNNETLTIMGHVLKTGWCLVRLYKTLGPNDSWLASSQLLVNSVLQKGYDNMLGGPYKDFNRITGVMQMWGLPDTAKAWWQMEQAIVAGLMLYDQTKEIKYLRMADETTNFYMKYFVDHTFGEVYADRTRYGGFAWNEAKGNRGKAGYHSTETGYYIYLYGNLLLKNQPVKLHYRILPADSSRTLKMTPMAIENNRLIISEVKKDDAPYLSYNPSERTISLPAGEGGDFEVTYMPVITSIAEKIPSSEPSHFKLFQNYPNPFNPSTTIRYSIDSPDNVLLKVYDAIGNEVAILTNGIMPAGTHEVIFDGSHLSGGVYICKLTVGAESAVKKVVLIK